jgi:hypothetical protein
VNALRGAAAAEPKPEPRPARDAPKLFGDIGSLGKFFGFI